MKKVTTIGLCLMALLIVCPAFSEVTLTGAVQFSTDSHGAVSGGQVWNTLGGDEYYNLWLARNPDGTLPINGSSDAQAAINVPLVEGETYTFYMFGQRVLTPAVYGLNLFFNGDNAKPGISVFAPINSSQFAANGSMTFQLNAAPVAGSGTTSYKSGGLVVVMDSYNWRMPPSSAGDKAQATFFSAGDGADFCGSFTLRVLPAASLSAGVTGGSLTMTGSGFSPDEVVTVYAGHIGAANPVTVEADHTGSFSVATHEPEHTNGPLDIFAVGQSSSRAGVATLRGPSVTTRD